MGVDFLAIEVFTFTPHLEASGEICIEQLGHSNKVAHCFIDIENPDDTFTKQSIWFSKKNKVIRLHKILRKKNIDVRYFNLIRKSISKDIAEFASIELSSLGALRDLSYKGANLGIGVASSFISKTKSSEPDINNESIKLLQTYLKSSATVYEKSIELIKEMNPKKVMVFNGRFACVKAIAEAAKQMGVPVVFYERGATSERYVLVDKPIHNFKGIRERRDNAWEDANDCMKDIARQFFERRRNGDGIGWLSFTQDQEKNKFPDRVKDYRLVYFSSSDDEFAAVEDAVEHRAFDSQRSAIKWLIDWVGKKDNIELIVRVHPHLAIKSEKERYWWDSLSGKNITLIPSGDKTDSYSLAESADIVLVYNSTIGVEASYWGVPSIAIGDTLYSGLDCVYEPFTVKELENLLENTNLPSKLRDNCLSYGYYALTFGEKYKYFEADGLFIGKFFGDWLTYESRVHQLLRRGCLMLKEKFGCSKV